ncbi:hypothetical protein lerEdw1_009536 [Lerista edwardsae]|nr:hypothetical protein lerEdw1_009536 [Lerista edwardsae]
MTQGFWKVYKAKVLQTLGGESQDEDLQDEMLNALAPSLAAGSYFYPQITFSFQREIPEMMETTDSTLLTEEGTNPVSQLARRVQGAGVKGWRTVSTLFSREDEHKLLASESCADHPLAARPAEEEEDSEKKTPGLWDVFTTKWQQTSALEKVAPRPDAREQRAEEGSERSGEMAAEDDGNTGPDSDLRDAEGAAFKWSFLTNKLAEIRNKNAPKSN